MEFESWWELRLTPLKMILVRTIRDTRGDVL